MTISHQKGPLVVLMNIGEPGIYHGCNVIGQDHFFEESYDDQLKPVPSLQLIGRAKLF